MRAFLICCALASGASACVAEPTWILGPTAGPGAGPEVDGGTSITPPPPGPSDPLDVALGRLECLTVSGETSGLTWVDARTGQLTPVGVRSPLRETFGLAWLGDVVVTCDPAGQDPSLYVIDLTLGVSTAHDRVESCATIAGSDRGLLMNTNRGVLRSYANLEEVLLEGGSPDIRMNVQSLGVYEDTIAGAWHASDAAQVGRFGLREPQEVPLEDYDGWIHGIAPFPEGLIIVSDHLRGDQTLRIFSSTGALLRVVPVEQPLWGLTCRAR